MDNPSLEKKMVQSFYDEFGWVEDDSTAYFMDACIYEDLRPITASYRTRANERVEEVLARHGEYLLDVASGPIQFEDYVRFSNGFRKRVCVDLSIRGLLGAKRRIGDHGLFVMADITHLPFRADAFDSIVSLHTIYHVPENEQGKAVRELYRTLKPGHSAVVVYAWPSLVSRAKRFLSHVPIISALVRRASDSGLHGQDASEPDDSPVSLYYHPHSLGWFKREFSSLFDMEVRCWRSMSVPTLKRIPESGIGKLVLQVIGQLEDRWPRMLGRFGRYPLIAISKSSSSP